MGTVLDLTDRHLDVPAHFLQFLAPQQPARSVASRSTASSGTHCPCRSSPPSVCGPLKSTLKGVWGNRVQRAGELVGGNVREQLPFRNFPESQNFHFCVITLLQDSGEQDVGWGDLVPCRLQGGAPLVRVPLPRVDSPIFAGDGIGKTGFSTTPARLGSGGRRG